MQTPNAEWLKHRAAVLEYCIMHDIGLTLALCPFVTSTDVYLVGPIKKTDCGTVTAAHWEKEINHASMPVQKVHEAFALLREILCDNPKNGAVCPVCSNYHHKSWCWYPRLLAVLGYPLDKFDQEFLEAECSQHEK